MKAVLFYLRLNGFNAQVKSGAVKVGNITIEDLEDAKALIDFNFDI